MDTQQSPNAQMDAKRLRQRQLIDWGGLIAGLTFWTVTIYLLITYWINSNG